MTSALTGAIIQEVFGNSSSNQTSANPSSNGYSSFDWSNLLGPVGNFAAGFINHQNAKKAAQRQFERQKELMDLQYQYNQRSLRESPSNYRYGLVSAGYNPILPFASSGASAMQGGPVGLGSASAETPAFIDQNAINGAMLLKMQKDKMQSEIDTMMSQRKVNNANAEYLFQKGISEEFEQKIKNLEISRKSIENEWLPKKYKAQIDRDIAEAKASLISSFARLSEAHTGIVNARVNERNATTNEVNSRINSIDVMNRFTLGQDQLELEWNKLIREQQYDAIKSLVKDLITVYGIGRCAPMLKPLLSKSPQAVHQAIKTMGDPVYQSIMNSKL